MIAVTELVERIQAYDAGTDRELIDRAYAFSKQAHGSQKRESGDAYFSHPVEVAGIITQMRLDGATVATALLHDTVEDTLATLQDIEAHFGSEIARLVDGVTKLSRLEMPSDRTLQAENFRKLLLAMSNDIRVLLVKLADRLHNMQTLHHIRDAEKRKRIAIETMEIYVPLAERIGMQHMKEELEDCAFSELNPDAWGSLHKRLEFLRAQGGDLVARVTDELRRTIAAGGIDAQVTGREKKPYSIWRKMERKNISFEQLSDIMALRITVERVADCYVTLGIVHRAYPLIPGRFKDYISVPKLNKYSALHTTVIGPERKRIEVQICDKQMLAVADYGVAAHWQYKQQREPTDGSQYRWIRELLEILEHAPTAEEFLENTKLEMFQDEVFCFSPKGDLIVLPRGATPVDFAYAVHTDIGDTCVGARVNGRLAPLRAQLANGDQVEIVRSSGQTPSPSWENLVVTGKARLAIRRFVRNQERSQYLELGRSIVDKALGRVGRVPSDSELEAVLDSFHCKTVDDLCVGVGNGTHTARAVVDAVIGREHKPGRAGRVLSFVRSRTRLSHPSDDAVPIRGLIPGVAVHFGDCCHPLPGERIVGISTSGKGVIIHTIDCDTLETVSDAPERWLDVAWDAESAAAGVHAGRILALVANEPGSLSAMTTVIAKNEGNISNLKILNRSEGFFEFQVDIEVRDLKHLTQILAALRNEAAIASVKRVRG
jgi:guanosine-3',5'-bis(diphosphate) 3'-pyrophosphohydrolase